MTRSHNETRKSRKEAPNPVKRTGMRRELVFALIGLALGLIAWYLLVRAGMIVN